MDWRAGDGLLSGGWFGGRRMDGLNAVELFPSEDTIQNIPFYLPFIRAITLVPLLTTAAIKTRTIPVKLVC